MVSKYIYGSSIEQMFSAIVNFPLAHMTADDTCGAIYATVTSHKNNPILTKNKDRNMTSIFKGNDSKQ